MKKIIPVILCGGSGTRLWPLSRQKTPKQFLRLIGEETLLQKTARRALQVLDDASPPIVTITLADMVDETREQMEALRFGLGGHVVEEPESRNTAAAVALAIQYIKKEFGPDCYIWILPADHHIGDESALREAIIKARHAADENCLVTFGINPTRPETGYGYIQKAEALNGSGAYRVRKFHEKPAVEIAQQFVESGHYLWSSGMHLFDISTGENNFQTHSPDVWNCVAEAVANGSMAKPHALDYARTNKEPFETAVLEKSDQVAVVPCDPQWSDIGSWESLWEINSKDINGNACKGTVYCEDTHNSMVMAGDRLVTCIGLSDVIVIETGDSVLVANKSCGNSLKELVNLLRKQKRREIEFHLSKDHTWGKCKTLFKSGKSLIRECLVNPGQSYSYTVENGNTEWFIIEGSATITNGDQVLSYAAVNESITLPAHTACIITNTGNGALRFMEVRSSSAAETLRTRPLPRAIPGGTLVAALAGKNQDHINRRIATQ